MARRYRTNIATIGGYEAVFALKEMLVAGGWTVVNSGTGVGGSYSSTGDLLTNVAVLKARSAVWFRIRAPAVRGQSVEFTFQCNVSGTWIVRCSLGAGFIGGSPAANIAPVAADARIISTGVASFNAAATSYASIMVDDDGAWFLVGWSSAGVPSAFWALDAIIPGSGDSDPPPFVGVASGGSGTAAAFINNPSADSRYLNDRTGGPCAWIPNGAGGWSAGGVVGYYYGAASNYETFHATQNAGELTGTSKTVALPLIYARPVNLGDGGFCGVSSLFKVPARPRPSLHTSADLAWLAFGHLLVPWDGASTPATLSEPVAFDVFAPVMVPTPDPIPPVVAIVSPVDGSAIASNEAVVIDVTDNIALRRVVVFASTPGATDEVVFDGNAFAPGYAFASAATPTAGGLRLNIVRDSGWRGDPGLDVIAIDEAGNETTASAAYTLAGPQRSTLAAWLDHAAVVVESLTPRFVSESTGQRFVAVDGLLNADDEPMILDRHFDTVLVDVGAVLARWGNDYAQRSGRVDVVFVYDRHGNRREADERLHEDAHQVGEALSTPTNFGSARIQQVNYTGAVIESRADHRVDVRLSFDVLYLEPTQ